MIVITPWFTTTGLAIHTMITIHWHSITHPEQMVVNHGVLYWAIGYESWCDILCQWLWIRVCYADLEVVNGGELHCASGWKSWCVMLCQWIVIMVCNARPVVVNHGVMTIILCYALMWFWIMVCYTEPSVTHHHSLLLGQHSTPWFTTTGTEYHTMIHNQLLSITHHD
jgi:hypothetical protein